MGPECLFLQKELMLEAMQRQALGSLPELQAALSPVLSHVLTPEPLQTAWEAQEILYRTIFLCKAPRLFVLGSFMKQRLGYGASPERAPVQARCWGDPNAALIPPAFPLPLLICL